jgi:multicomponent Na+:H+ antiporter subunit D
VLAIAGIPPLNGYVSLGLIHEALQSSGQLAPLVALLIAQVLTVAALGRAAYLAFYRARGESYQVLERLRPGMLAALCTLGAGCVGFGVAATAVVQRIAAPAAGALLHGASFAAGVLTGAADLPRAEVSFDYVKPEQLLVIAATVLAAALLGRRYLRRAEPVPIRLLRAAHTGSVNDYTAYAVLGAICTLTVLLIRP